MDLVERVARRRHERKSMWPWDSVQDKRAKLAEVRADITEILDAMGEPSDTVATEGADHLFAASSDDWNDDARRVWQAMLAQFKAENVK